MSKYSRSGGKYTGNHTTLIPAAQVACDIANELLEVTKIAPGFIESGLKPANGRKRVKFTEEGGCLLLSVRDNTSHQEVRLYVTNVQVARTAIARKVLRANIAICFRKEV